MTGPRASNGGGDRRPTSSSEPPPVPGAGAPGAGAPGGAVEVPDVWGSDPDGLEGLEDREGPDSQASAATACGDLQGLDSEAGEEAVVREVAALVEERDDYRDALIRLQADFENYKKRMIKQQTEHLERAAQALVDKLLPVLDTADLALAHGGGEDVKQLSGALLGALEREGLERIDPDGGSFDPTIHDAVAHEPHEGGGMEVVEVLRAGYRWKGRLLRPAMVRVRG